MAQACQPNDIFQMCQWIYLTVYHVSMLTTNVIHFILFPLFVWVPSTWEWNSMTGVFTTTWWLYLVLFLTWFDCSINVSSQGFACMNLHIYIHMYLHVIADDLGACCFYTNMWEQIVQGFSCIYKHLMDWGKLFNTLTNTLLSDSSDHSMVMWNIWCWCYFLPSEPKLKLTNCMLTERRKHAL